MKQIKLMLLAVILSVIAASSAHATDVGTSWTSSDVREVNYLTPGSQKTDLGTRLQGPTITGSTTSAACSTSLSACNTVATTETTAVTLKTTGASWGESFALADGYKNQVKTYVLVTDGGKNLRVSPTTKSGFTYVELDDAKDTVTLKFIDSTTGWVVTGNSGANVG